MKDKNKKIAEYCTKHSLHHGCKYPSCTPCIQQNKSIEDVVEGFMQTHIQFTRPLNSEERLEAIVDLISSLTSLVQQSKEEERDKVFEEFKDDTLIGQVAFKKGMEMNKNIGMLRQFLNEEKITDPKKLVTNEDLSHWLKTTHNNLNNKT